MRAWNRSDDPLHASMSRGWAKEAGVRPHINLEHDDADNREELKSRVRRWMPDEGRKARRTMDDDLITVTAKLNELCGEVSDEDVLKLTATNPERRKQIAFDAYYLNLGKAVENGADCLGSRVGAVVVLKNRVVSTGYNGTPSGFTNCSEKGCVRCYDSWLSKTGRAEEMSDPEHTSGKSLDRCICVHAEQNAFLTAARFGIALEGATLYSTQSPCFGCLKEAVQIGIGRVVYTHWYRAKYSPKLNDSISTFASSSRRVTQRALNVSAGLDLRWKRRVSPTRTRRTRTRQCPCSRRA